MRTLMKQNRLSGLFLKDKVGSFETNEMKLPKIHGETDIILKDVKTGMVDRFHSENTFQAWALANYTKQHGIFRVNSGFDWTELVGGIYLFRDQIAVGAEYMPAGNEMTGSGANGYTNGSRCTEFGSFNGADSAATASAIRQVWEFNTSQANGNINCVCLGNKYGALIGYGNKSGYRQGDYNMNPGYSNESSGYVGMRDNIYYNGYVYSWYGVSENTATIRKTRYSGDVGSVFHNLYSDLTYDMTEVGQPWTDWDTSGSIDIGDVGGGIFRFNPFYSHNVAPGGTGYYYEFNANDESLTLKTFINSSATTLMWSRNTVRFFSDLIVVQSDGGSHYRANIFKASTGEYLRSMDLARGFGPGDSSRDYPPSEIADNLLFLLTTEYEVRPEGANQAAWGIYDAVADTFKMTGLGPGNDRHYNVGTRMKSMDILKNEGWGAKPYKFHNPFYLATINNLSETIPKTAAKTMKVIYTLTEV